MITTKIEAIKELLENELKGKYVTFYGSIADYNQERGLATEEEGFEDIIERQESSDDVTIEDLRKGFLVIDESGSSEFRVYRRDTVENEDASYFE